MYKYKYLILLPEKDKEIVLSYLFIINNEFFYLILFLLNFLYF